MLPMRFISYLLLFLCSCKVLNAQQPLLRHYTILDGLPSNVIYDVYQDSKGFVWFCTDQGVSRFDGTEFHNYSIKDGLPDTEIFRIREDGQHRYWLICYNTKACYLLNGKVYTAANDPLCRNVEQAGIWYDEVFKTQYGTYWLAGLKIGKLTQGPPYLHIASGIRLGQGRLYYFSTHGTDYVVTRKGLLNINSGWHLEVSDGGILESYFDGTSLFLFKDSRGGQTLDQWHVARDSIYKVNSASVPGVIYNIVQIAAGQLHCSTAKGVYSYNIATGIFEKYTVFPAGIRSNRMLYDTDGNFWVGTLNNGVYCRPANGGMIFNRESGLAKNNILSLGLSAGNGLIAGDDEGNLNLIRNGRIQTCSIRRPGTAHRIMFADEVDANTAITGGDQGLYKVDWRSNTARLLFLHAFKNGIWRRPYYYAGFVGGWLKIDTRTWQQSLREEEYKITALEMDTRDILWLGRINGVEYYNEGRHYIYRHSRALSESRIICMTVSPTGDVILGTSSNGLFIIRDPGQPPLQLTKINGLRSNNCKRLYVAADGCIWICSEDGLDKLWVTPEGHYTVSAFTLPGSVSGNKINDMREDAGKLYLATYDGIVVLNSRDTGMGSPPRLYIDAVNNRVLSEQEKKRSLEFTYSDRNVQVAYTGVSFGSAGLQYKYLLKGGTSDTLYTSARTIDFSALSPGSYELYLWARSPGSSWTQRPVQLAFRVLPPFWMHPLFIAALALLLLTAGVLLYHKRVRKIQRRAALEAQNRQQLAELEMKALRAQINPHFIFNALNSIQSYYSQHDELKANHYMTSFARFIRLTLTHSQSHWLPLGEEIDMLRIYIELEQMRFKQLFTFSIEVGAGINPEEVTVPAMLIQPYVENAINHGLRYLEDRPGQLAVRFILKGDALLCEVEDNGIGMTQAAAIRPLQHNSMGMKINRERINTISRMYDIMIRLSVEEKQAPPATSTGTLISLLVPLRKKF